MKVMYYRAVVKVRANAKYRNGLQERAIMDIECNVMQSIIYPRFRGHTDLFIASLHLSASLRPPTNLSMYDVCSQSEQA